MRSIPNVQCNELVSIAFIWMIKWISTIFSSQKAKIKRMDENIKNETAGVKEHIEKQWKQLQKDVNKQVSEKEKEIEILKMSLQRMTSDKQRIEEVLRNRDEEINLLMRNTDFSCKHFFSKISLLGYYNFCNIELRILIEEMKDNLNEFDQQTDEVSPYLKQLGEVVSSMKKYDADKIKQFDDLSLN